MEQLLAFITAQQEAVKNAPDMDDINQALLAQLADVAA